MGGKGSGGRRVGSGQKGKPGVVVRHPSAPSPPASIVTCDPPPTLTGTPLQVWRELAPHALEKRTLTPATTAAFVMLCRAIVLERSLGASKKKAGGTNHRGLQQRVGTWLKDFCLAPLGKPIAAATPAAPVSKWAGLLR